MLAARQHTEAVLSPLIRPDLKVREEVGYTLNLAQDRTRTDSGEQAAWVALGKFAFIGCFEIDLGQVRKRLPTERGLARLAWSRHGHEGVALEQTLEDGGNVARNHGGHGTTSISQIEGCTCKLLETVTGVNAIRSDAVRKPLSEQPATMLERPPRGIRLAARCWG